MFGLTPEQEGHLALLPTIHRSTERLEGDLQFALRDIDRRLNTMSQALDDVLGKVSTTADQVIELLHTDQSSLAALQSSVDALKAAQGDDSAEVAQAQAVLDKLTAAVAPAPPAGSGSAAPGGAASGATGATTDTTGTATAAAGADATQGGTAEAPGATQTPS